MKKVFLLFAVPLLFACNQPQPNDKAKAINTGIPVEHVDPTKDQLERRQRSEAICKAHGVPVYTNPNSFFSDPESAVTIRPQDSVADRALALCYIGVKSEGLNQDALNAMDKAYHISEKLSPAELAYAKTQTPTEQQKIDANWRYEDRHVMLWALGFIDTLYYPDKACNVAADVKIIHDLTEAQFKQKAKLRSKQEIMDQADLILRLDWACVDARTKGKDAPGGLNKDVVVEWHRALNWLIHYSNQDWDNVTTDT